MYYSIDRFEDAAAVLQDDDGKNITVIRTLLPADAKQGDVLKLENGRYLPAPDETARRRKYIRELQEKLFKKR